jgi:hypothetical protein
MNPNEKLLTSCNNVNLLAMWIIRALLLVLGILSDIAEGLKAEWIQLSESASLPMSKKHRDDLREKISRLDAMKLNEADRAKIDKLKRMLEEPTDDYHDYDDLDISSIGKTLFIVLIFAVSASVVYMRGKQIPSIPGVSSEELRKARVRKYQ